MLIDAFPFFNECDLLEGRLEYLDEVVDQFIIVESNVTHSGKPKPYNFLDNINRFAKYTNKIVYLQFTPDISGMTFDHTTNDRGFNADQWKLEIAQRNYITEGLRLAAPSDIIMVSDLDEIPNKDLIRDYKHLMQSYSHLKMKQKLFYHGFDTYHGDNWPGTIMTTVQNMITNTPQSYRGGFIPLPFIDNGGWHLSYFNSLVNIKYKIESFAHQELNETKFTDIDSIREKISNGVDIYGRNINYEPFDVNTLPKDFYSIFGKYSRNKESYK